MPGDRSGLGREGGAEGGGRGEHRVGVTMTAGSAAQVLLAWDDPERLSVELMGARFDASALSGVRRRGWAQSVAEREAGVASLSAPIRDAAGTVVAAISVSGPVDRIGRRPGVKWAADLLAAADAIHKRL